MHITGERDGPPVKVGVAVTDLTTGLYTSNSVMAALLARMKTGRGQHIDVALSDCQVATLANIASSCLISGKRDTGRWGTSHRKFTIPSVVRTLTSISFHSTLQGLQNSRRRYPPGRWQRSALRRPLQPAWETRVDHRQAVQGERAESAKQRHVGRFDRGRDEAEDYTGVAGCA